jgi:hypothetical protein
LSLGLDPLAFLNSKDGFERGLMIELASRALENKKILDENLATAIANAVAKAFK